MRAEHRELWDLLGHLRAALAGPALDTGPIRATELAVVERVLCILHLPFENCTGACNLQRDGVVVSITPEPMPVRKSNASRTWPCETIS